MNREIDPAIQQCLVNFLGKQAFTADLGKTTVLDDIAGRLDRMLLEHIHTAQDGTERGQ